MDSQAEALRFLQDAYLGEGTEGTKYANVWKAITANAINADEDMSYNPSTCDETLDDITKNHGFVINYRALGTGDVKQILLRPTSLSGSGTTSFETAKTYPRLLYGAPDSDSLIDDNAFSNSTTVKKAEGIYIIAVRDNKTNVAEGGTISTQSAYYDFYIRSCWYASGANTPSTISTVVRLYDPDVDEANNQGRGHTVEGSKFVFHNTEVTDNYNPSGNQPATEYTQNGLKTGAVNNFHDISKMNFNRVGYSFQGWCSVQATKASATVAGSCSGNTYSNGYGYQLPLSLTKIELHFFAIWKPNPSVRIVYNGNGSTSGNMTDQTITPGGRKTNLKDNRFVRAGHTFQGWCTKAIGVGGACNGEKYEGQGPSFTNKQEISTATSGGTLTLYAMWKKNPDYVIEYKGNGNTSGSMANTVITGGMTSKLRANAFSKTDYKWTGWCTVAVGVGASCTGTKYNDQQSVTAPVSGGKLTLYAMWSTICNFTSQTFEFTGGMRSWTVPKGCGGTYQLELWGAQGGTQFGGKGAYVTGTMSLAEGKTIYIGVGGQPPIKNGEGGFNGGGIGGGVAPGQTYPYNRGGGGGATHISSVNKTVPELLNVSYPNESAIYLLAAGGGGGAKDGNRAFDTKCTDPNVGTWIIPSTVDYAYGGAGGGTIGGDGTNPGTIKNEARCQGRDIVEASCIQPIATHPNCETAPRSDQSCRVVFIRNATGATQSSGGIGAIGTDFASNGFNKYAGSSGGHGIGGSSANFRFWSPGGGGGFYGGGSGAPSSCRVASGGGGSSYTGAVGSSRMQSDQRTGNGLVIITRK